MSVEFFLILQSYLLQERVSRRSQLLFVKIFHLLNFSLQFQCEENKKSIY